MWWMPLHDRRAFDVEPPWPRRVVHVLSPLLEGARRAAPRALLAIVSAGSVLTGAEAGLRLLAPVSLVTIGHRFNANAALYGWGYGPGETIVISDPDTGEVYVDRTNAAGWRDRDHVRGRVQGVFRILVLGDSVTVGAIVGLDDLFTRRAEDLLQRKGYSAEVISIALGGWGTDQELEALRLEGLSYAPDLVVVEFTGNDPWDNLEPMEGGKKPFRYELEPGGTLLRRSNPWFVRKHKEELRGLAWRRFRDRFEILKRAALLSERLRGKERPKVQPAPGSGAQVQYVVGDWGLGLLSEEFGIDAKSDVATWLRERRGQTFDPRDLRARLRSTPQAGRSEEILRTFEKRWFQEIYTRELERIALDPRSDVGRLQLALLDEMLRLTLRSGAGFLLLSTHEDGQFDWERYWFHVGTDPGLRERYLALNDPLRNWARARNVDFLLPAGPVVRARNDPHPNKQGNKVLARTLARYVEARYGPAMPRRQASE
jgi:hypothetical protein